MRYRISKLNCCNVHEEFGLVTVSVKVEAAARARATQEKIEKLQAEAAKARDELVSCTPHVTRSLGNCDA